MGVDSAGFDELYRNQHRRLVAMLIAVSGASDLAHDAADEAFTRAWGRWGRVGTMESPTGWLYGVALNVLRRSLRRRATEARLRHRLYAPATEVASHPDVWAAVRTLPPRQRVAVALRFVADLPESDIAAAMGVSRGTVSATLAAARRRLAELLGDATSDEVIL